MIVVYLDQLSGVALTPKLEKFTGNWQKVQKRKKVTKKRQNWGTLIVKILNIYTMLTIYQGVHITYFTLSESWPAFGCPPALKVFHQKTYGINEKGWKRPKKYFNQLSGARITQKLVKKRNMWCTLLS